MIGLITDFKLKDSYVAEMKAVMYCIHKQGVVIDITHDIPFGDIEAAAFLLERCWKSFPAETVFCGVIDPGVGTSRKAIMGKSKGMYFVGPDNGLFSYLFPPQQVKLIPDHLSRKTPGNTFQGRDLFAVAAANLDKQQDNFLNSQGISYSGQLVKLNTAPVPKVMWIDNFGNAILSMKPEHLFTNAPKFCLNWRNYSFSEIYPNYQALAPHQVGLVTGGSGYLELAARDKCAAEILKINRGDILDVRN